MNVDAVDLKILQELSSNSRQSYRQIAKKTRVSPNTVFLRLKKLVDEKKIKSFSIEPDYEKLGIDTAVIIDIRFNGKKIFQTESKIAKMRGVLALYDVTGDFDALVIARLSSTKELDILVKEIQKLDFVERTNTRLILNTVKQGQAVQ